MDYLNLVAIVKLAAHASATCHATVILLANGSQRGAVGATIRNCLKRVVWKDEVPPNSSFWGRVGGFAAHTTPKTAYFVEKARLRSFQTASKNFVSTMDARHSHAP